MAADIAQVAAATGLGAEGVIAPVAATEVAEAIGEAADTAAERIRSGGCAGRFS